MSSVTKGRGTSIADTYNALNAVLSLLNQEFGFLEWSVIDAHSQSTVYIYAPSDVKQCDEKTGYYVGIETRDMSCWVTGNPGWACLFKKGLNVASMTPETTEYIVSNIKQLIQRYKDDQRPLLQYR